MKSFDYISKSLADPLSHFIKSISLYSDILCKEYSIIMFNLSCILLKYSMYPNIISSFSYFLKIDYNRQIFYELDLLKTLYSAVSLSGDIMRTSILAVGRLLFGTEAEISYLLENNVLDVFDIPLSQDDRPAIKHALWAISLIADSNEAHIDVLIKHKIFKKSIYFILYHDEEIRYEASFIFLNSCKLGGSKIAKNLKEIGIIYFLPEALFYPEPQYLINLLKGIECIVQHSISLFEGTECKDALIKLSYHINTSVSELASILINEFEVERDYEIYEEEFYYNI